MARKLVLLHMHHLKLYAFLNALVNILLKDYRLLFTFGSQIHQCG